MRIIKFLVGIGFYILIGANPLSLQSQGKQMLPGKFPQIGNLCPDFALTDIQHYKQRRATLKDFKGKWLVLYFWSKGCTTSLTNFTKLEKLQHEYGDKLTFMLIGPDDAVNKEIYHTFYRHYKLSLPVTFEKELADDFGVPGFPHIVMVNPKGIVKAISYTINREGIDRLLNKENSGLPYSFNKAEKESNKLNFNSLKPFLVDGNGGTGDDFIYRSILTKWEPSMGMIGTHAFRSRARPNEVLITGADLARLYLLAYNDRKYLFPFGGENDYGKWWPKPILEVKDTSAFGHDYNMHSKIYTYSLVAPKEKTDPEIMQKMMRRDLQNIFGYKVRLEKRTMPYYKLTASKKAKEKLRTSGGAKSDEGNGITSFKIVNQPVSRLIKFLWGYNQKKPPFIDETGIDYHIDITMEGILTDFEYVKTELEKQGLFLTLSKKEMFVVVISDP